MLTDGQLCFIDVLHCIYGRCIGMQRSTWSYRWFQHIWHFQIRPFRFLLYRIFYLFLRRISLVRIFNAFGNRFCFFFCYFFLVSPPYTIMHVHWLLGCFNGLSYADGFFNMKAAMFVPYDSKYLVWRSWTYFQKAVDIEDEALTMFLLFLFILWRINSSVYLTPNMFQVFHRYVSIVRDMYVETKPACYAWK